MNFRKIGAAAGLWMSLGLTTHAAEKPPQDEPTRSVITPLMAVDAQLRATIKDYIGLRTDKNGAVFLTISKGADLEAAAQTAREAWLKAAGEAQAGNLPHFDFNIVAVGADQLSKAYEEMTDVLTLKDVASLDLDEACGCIAVGVIADSAIARVAEFAAQRRILKEWLRISVTQPIIRTLDLRDIYRPTMGGIQIENKNKAACTLGLPVYSFARGSYGFLTASHCTEGIQGAMRGTSFYQSGGQVFGTDWIGDEALDLPMFDRTTDSACPPKRMCRRSDTAFAEYSNPQHYIVGRVTQPTTTCVTAGGKCSLGVARATDDIRMVGAVSGLFAGTSVDKIGRTSGRTSGVITNTCARQNVFDRGPTGFVDTGITILCQYEVATTSLPGDSGSPVFVSNAASGTGLFAGILWGGAFDGSSMVFSPISGIDGELGSFVYNQAGAAAPFVTFTPGTSQFYTSDLADELQVTFARNAVQPGEIEIVLDCGPNVLHRKEIVLVEGPAAGIGRWTLGVDNKNRFARDGLYMYQLPGGRLEFRKQIGGGMYEVSRVPIDAIPSGSRVTFTWRTD